MLKRYRISFIFHTLYPSLKLHENAWHGLFYIQKSDNTRRKTDKTAFNINPGVFDCLQLIIHIFSEYALYSNLQTLMLDKSDILKFCLWQFTIF